MEGQDTPFAASIAVYPYCKSGPLDSNTPSLILIGEKDDWALPSACSFYMPGEAGYYLENKPKHEVILKIYPGAYHDFNWPDVESVPGHILKYNPEATADAAVRIKNFLCKHLK